MSDSTSTTGGMSPSGATPTAGTGLAKPPTPGSDVSSLQTEHGTTTIAEAVVSKIAALAAREVDGVADLGGSVGSALGSVVGRIRGSERNTAGVGVEVGSTQAAVDLTMKVTYPASIHQVADAVRENVIERIESMTGLEVVEVNIAVVDLVFPGQPTSDDEESEPSRPTRVE